MAMFIAPPASLGVSGARQPLALCRVLNQRGQCSAGRISVVGRHEKRRLLPDFPQARNIAQYQCAPGKAGLEYGKTERFVAGRQCKDCSACHQAGESVRREDSEEPQVAQFRSSAVERAPQRCRIAQITAAELDVIVEIVGTAFAVHLRNEAVEHADVATVAEQLVCEMRADEPRATSDEHVVRHAAAPVCADAPMPVSAFHAEVLCQTGTWLGVIASDKRDGLFAILEA